MKLKKIGEKLFSNNKKLELINLSDNHLSMIHPEALSNLPNLTVLDLRDNLCISTQLKINLGELTDEIKKNCYSNKTDDDSCLSYKYMIFTLEVFAVFFSHLCSINRLLHVYT